MADRVCIIADCGRPHNAHGWCLMHYKRWQKYGDPAVACPPRPHRECAVEGCERPWCALDWCSMHYQRVKTYGDVHRRRVRRLCTVAGCEKFRVSNGWCSKHHARWERHGSPTARIPGEILNDCMICSHCGIDKPTGEYAARRAGRCKECRAAYLAEPERRKVRKAWAASNPQRVREYGRRGSQIRRARLASSSTVAFTASQLAARMDYFGGRCWMCRGPFEHVDHVKPLSKGGAHILANLRPSCGPCNRRKSGTWEGIASARALAA